MLLAIPGLALLAVLAARGAAQELTGSATNGATEPRVLAHGSALFDRVLHDVDSNGVLWARGASWKASFDSAGFTYLPALGAGARSAPLAFRRPALRVGAREVLLESCALATREGDRVILDRGALREIYELRPESVEQRFEITTQLAGDVELELALDTMLADDARTAGLCFADACGGVDYGDAFLVRGGAKLPLATEHRGGVLRWRISAADRDDGPVVIDPLLTTRAVAAPNALLSPDIAFDLTNEVYLCVYELVFDELDHDVLCVMLDAGGNPIPGSAEGIDITSRFASSPKVANLNSADRFLVVSSIYDPLNSNRPMIFGRARDAGGNRFLHPENLLSDPSLAGENYIPDVGADPSTEPGHQDFLVVWANSLSGTQAAIQGRVVMASGFPRSSLVLPIQAANFQRNWNVAISNSNGNGLVSQPMWLVVYTRSTPATGSDVYLHRVLPDGTVQPEMIVDAGPQDDRSPQVSSPAELAPGETGYLVAYERPLAVAGVMVRVRSGGQTVFQYQDFEQQFSAGRYTPRVESDGQRFVLTASRVNPNSTLPDYTRAFTFLYENFRLVLHDVATLPGVVTEPRIVAQRSSGGLGSSYGIAFLQLVNGWRQPAFALYAGQMPGPSVEMLATACDGLHLNATGSTGLGNAVRFELLGLGADLPALVLGGANVFPLPFCGTCALGLRLDLPTFAFVGSPTLLLSVPRDTWLLGETFAVQGFGIGAGTCGLRFSETAKLTVR
ncbi:MAG: hypothetical protein IPN34_16085 [Planctomycetes bacterium]|nr:hypothetical protein [Planctomycetota bacterium]